MILYVMLFLCVFILMAMIYRYDLTHKEPWYMALLALVLGAISYYGIREVNDWVLLQLGAYDTLSTALAAGIGEELAKFFMVLLIAFCFHQHFNDPMDGIVYGAIVGIGFALVETVFYLDLAGPASGAISRQDLFGREAMRSVFHFLTGGLGGFGVGLARCKALNWKTILPTWLAAAIMIHVLWDYACGLNQADDFSRMVLQKTAAVTLMLFSMVLFRIAVWVADSWCKAHCSPDHGPHT